MQTQREKNLYTKTKTTKPCTKTKTWTQNNDTNIQTQKPNIKKTQSYTPPPPKTISYDRKSWLCENPNKCISAEWMNAWLAHPFDNYIAQPLLADGDFGDCAYHRQMAPPPPHSHRVHHQCWCAIRRSPANSVCLAGFPDDGRRMMDCCPSWTLRTWMWTLGAGLLSETPGGREGWGGMVEGVG